MNKKSLDRIFAPSSIAVVGASDQPGSVGGAVFTNLCSAGFSGPVWPVNRQHAVVGQRPAFAMVADLPETPDLVVVCTPAASVPTLIRECGQRGVLGMIVISAGFREAGAIGRQREAELQAVRNEFPDLRLIGPNCLGVLRPSAQLNASFSPVMPRSGRLTFLSQSGALCTAILDWSIEREIGFATCVSMGNMANVGMGELIDYFAEDDQTDALLLYIEGLDDAAHFLSAAKACTRRKPIIAYKGGRFPESSAAAASHTGAMASADAVYEVAFRHAGVERVNSIEEMFDCAKILVGPHRTWGQRLAIVTNAGGPGVMASDAWLTLGAPLAKLSAETLVALDQRLPPTWSHGNPVDVLGDATVERFQTAIQLVLKDPQVDAMLVILTPQTMTDPASIAAAVVAASRTTSKPIVASWIGGATVQAGRAILRTAHVPVYDFPEEAVRSLKHLMSAQNRSHPQGLDPDRLQPPFTPSVVKALVLPVQNGMITTSAFDLNRQSRWRQELAKTSGLIGEIRSKQMLADYGIPVVMTEIAHSVDEAVSLAETLKFPVVLKVVSPDISHKTDVGGVRLNLVDASDVRDGYLEMLASVERHAPHAKIAGVAVQKMVSAVRGIEVLLGMNRDPQFGLVLLLGAGGITAELQQDSALELPPFDDVVVDRMLHSLRLFPLLAGYRGRPGVDLDQLKNVILKFGHMAEELPELITGEINPLLVTADQVMALDARMISSGSLQPN